MLLCASLYVCVCVCVWWYRRGMGVGTTQQRLRVAEFFLLFLLLRRYQSWRRLCNSYMSVGDDDDDGLQQQTYMHQRPYLLFLG